MAPTTSNLYEFMVFPARIEGRWILCLAHVEWSIHVPTWTLPAVETSIGGEKAWSSTNGWQQSVTWRQHVSSCIIMYLVIKPWRFSCHFTGIEDFVHWMQNSHRARPRLPPRFSRVVKPLSWTRAGGDNTTPGSKRHGVKIGRGDKTMKWLKMLQHHASLNCWPSFLRKNGGCQ